MHYSIGGSFLGQHAEEHRVGYAIVHQGEHEDVDVGVVEPLVGPFYGHQAEDYVVDEVPVEVKFSEKPLKSLKLDADFAGEAKMVDNRLKQSVVALSKATTYSNMSLMCIMLMFFSKKRSRCLIIHYFCGRD